jgi:hypothetical protein
MIQGQFVQAQLPKGARAGDSIKVRVEANEDALILKLLGDNMAEKTAPGIEARLRSGLTGAMSSLLGVLLSEDKQLDIKKAADAFRESAAQSRGGGVRAEQKSEIPTALKLLFEKLRGDGATLDEAAFTDSSKVATTLAAFAERSLLNSAKEARRSVELLAREAQAKPLERFLQALTKQISEMLNAEGDLGFDEPAMAANEGAVKPQVGMSLALSHYALSTGQPQALSRVTEQLAQNSGKGNPLLVLLKVAFDSPVLQFQAPEGSANLAAAVDAFVKEIAALRNEGASDKVVRAALQKGLKNLNEALTGATKLSKNSQGIDQETISTAKTLERVLAGQDALNQVNSVLRSFGEPSLLMVPLVLQGLCIPLEVLIHPPGISPDEHKKSKGKFQGGYQRIELRVSLPTLGGVAVEIALRKEEALVTFALEYEELFQFVAGKTELLASRLREVGFKEAAVSARQGSPDSALLSRLVAPVSTVTVA